MGRTAGEQGASAVAAKPPVAQHGGGEQGWNAEAGEQERMPGQMGRSEDLGDQLVRVTEEGADEPAIRGSVRPERSGGRVDRLAEDDRRLPIERMRDRRMRLDPSQPMLGERECRKVRREDAERVRRGADVVVIAGAGELGGPSSAADAVRCFEDEYGRAVARQLDRGSQAVGTTADDDSVQTLRQRGCYAAGVAATTSPLASTIPSSQTASTRPPWNCCS